MNSHVVSCPPRVATVRPALRRRSVGALRPSSSIVGLAQQFCTAAPRLLHARIARRPEISILAPRLVLLSPP